MKDKTILQDLEFKLRTYKKEDYSGIADLNNVLFPNHPVNEDILRYNDKIREKTTIC